MAWNVALVAVFPRVPPRWVQRPARVTQLNAYWHMFAPQPRSDDAWMIAAAESTGGGRIDVLRGGGPIDPGTVEAVSGRVRSPEPRFAQPDGFRWLRFRERLVTYHPQARATYARYPCREWNSRNPDRTVRSIELLWAGEDVQVDGSRRPRTPRIPAGVECGPWITGLHSWRRGG